MRKTLPLLVSVALVALACGTGARPTPTPAGPTASPAPTALAPIKIGVLSTLNGAFAALGQEGVEGVQMALNPYKDASGKYIVAGREIQLLIEGTDATSAVALEKVKKLVEQDGVAIVIGPLSGDEGLTVKDYAKTVPNITFVNGAAGAQGISLRDPAPNFFNFIPNGLQQDAGLGDYAYTTKGYRTVATVGEDYSYPYTNTAGFVIPFCKAGGQVAQRNWVQIGTNDFSSVITRLPTDVDAVFVDLGGADAVNFFKQYDEAGGTAKFIGGSISVDQAVLSTQELPQARLVGLISAASAADTDTEPSWVAFDAAYRAQFPQGVPHPGLFQLTYYNATLATIMGLQAVNGDMGTNETALMNAIANVVVPGPTGNVRLDDHRAGIVSAFVVEVQQAPGGGLETAVKQKVDNVTQTLGLPLDDPLFAQDVSRDWPPCQ